MPKYVNGAGSSHTPDQTILRRTLFLMGACGIAAFIILAGKLFQLQILQHDYYEGKAVEQQVRNTNITASRGTIYDANNKILAMSASVDSIYISPYEIKRNGEDPALIARGLSEILGVDYDSIIEKTEKTNSWYETIAKKVEQDVADAVREFKNENNLLGIKIEADTKRYYPYSSLAAHVIGFVGTDNNGLSGVESKYEDYLKGVNGRIVRAKNSKGTDMLFTKFEDYYDAENGDDVYLTIDSAIQYYLEKHLENAVNDYDILNGAAAIAMDVKTGAILGMASMGGFDLNNYQMVDEASQELINNAATDEEKATLLYDAQQSQWRNKALSDNYEPGSTFKIITLAMALEENEVSLSDGFFCGGNTAVLGRDDPVKCWRTTGHGSQTLTQAVQHSCNVAFVNIGMRVGAEKFYEYAKAFGFFDPTGIDLGGETDSLWWPEEEFMNTKNLSSLAAASFGQTFNITPLQLITAVSACANGGYLMEPYVVREIRDSEGGVVYEHEQSAVRQVISEETSKTICEILESVVGDKDEGTGRNAYVAGYRVAGKTGTSEDVKKLADTGIKEYKVSFIGFAPADDPQVAVLVILDNPRQPSAVYTSGGQMAAPVVGKIFADVLPYMEVEAQYTEEEMVYVDKTVPDLKDMGVEAAKSKLAELGLTARVMGEGSMVTAQLPNPNAVIGAKSEVILYAGTEPSGEMEMVPDLTGLSIAQARTQLGYYGLFLRTSGGGSASESDAAVVVSQAVSAGSEVRHGAVIEISVVDNRDLGHY